MPDTDATTDTTDAPEQRDAADDTQSPDKLLATLQKERDARKALEREVKPLRTYKQEQEQARLTTEEKLAAREKATAEKEAHLSQRERSIAVRDGLASAAAAEKLSLNATSATVIRLLDLDRVEFDDTGAPKNLGTLLKQLAKDEPALFETRRRTGSADGGAGTGQGTGGDMNTLIRQAAGRG